MIGAAIATTAAALQGITGIAQAAKGRKIRKSTIRPDYVIPEEVKINLEQAKQDASFGLDAASKQIATQGIERGQAAGLYGAGSRRSGLAGLGGLAQSGNDAFANLAAMDNMERARKKATLSSARSEMAGYADKAWEINKFDPYKMSVDESQALTGAGMQNIGGALNTAASVGMYRMGLGSGEEGTRTPGTETPTNTTLTPEMLQLIKYNKSIKYK